MLPGGPLGPGDPTMLVPSNPLSPCIQQWERKTIHCTWIVLPEPGWTVLPTHLRSVTSPWVPGLLSLLWGPSKTKKQIKVPRFLLFALLTPYPWILPFLHMLWHGLCLDNRNKIQGANLLYKVRRTPHSKQGDQRPSPSTGSVPS